MENIASSTATLPEKPAPKDIFWNTNYNNKLVCNAMIDVTIAPDKDNIPRNWRNQVYRIHTRDNSHPPVEFKLVDLLFFWPHELTDMVAMVSNGMEALELVNHLEEQYGNTILQKRGLAVYYYQKI